MSKDWTDHLLLGYTYAMLIGGMIGLWPHQEGAPPPPPPAPVQEQPSSDLAQSLSVAPSVTAKPYGGELG